MTTPQDTTAPALSIQPPVAGSHHRADDGPTPTPEASPLGDLRRLRAQHAEANYIDLRVPGWGDDPDVTPRVHIYVRCRPIKPSELQAIRERRVPKAGSQKAKRPGANDYVDLINADALIVACLEVWAHAGDPVDPSELDESARLSLGPEPHGAKTRFDGNLADALGMKRNSDGTPPTAVEVCRYLFLHDGNVARTSMQLVEHSNLGAEREAMDFTSP